MWVWLVIIIRHALVSDPCKNVDRGCGSALRARVVALWSGRVPRRGKCMHNSMGGNDITWPVWYYRVRLSFSACFDRRGHLLYSSRRFRPVRGSTEDLPVSLIFVCPPHSQPGPDAKPNLNPIQTAPPKFVKSCKNGKLYTVGDENDLIYVVHVWGKQTNQSPLALYLFGWEANQSCISTSGTPYEMGYAQGELMTERAQEMISDTWSYIEEKVVGYYDNPWLW